MALFRRAEVRYHLKIRTIKMLKAASELADRHVTREHTARRAKNLDGLKDPRAHLGERPVDTEDAFQPEDLDRDVRALADGCEFALPGCLARSRQVDGPAHHGQDKLDIRIRTGHRP